MALIVTTYGDNPQQPSIAAEVYIPDQLIAGTLHLVTQPGTVDQVGGGAIYPRGLVMGQISATGDWIPSISGAGGGSGVPKGILVDVVNTLGGAVSAGVYIMGEFNFNAISYDSSWGTGATALLALQVAATAALIFKSTSAGLSQLPEN